MKTFILAILTAMTLGTALPAIAAPQVTSVLKTDGGPVRCIEMGAMNAYLRHSLCRPAHR